MPLRRIMYHDHDIPLFVPCVHAAVRLNDCFQRIAAVDDGSDLSRLDQVFEIEEILSQVSTGFTATLDALWGGPISGASMNPARSLGPALVAGVLDNQWIYLVTPVIGAVLGAAAYQHVL